MIVSPGSDRRSNMASSTALSWSLSSDLKKSKDTSISCASGLEGIRGGSGSNNNHFRSYIADLFVITKNFMLKLCLNYIRTVYNILCLLAWHNFRVLTFSVADPECLSRIPELTFFHPGSRICIKEFKYFNPKKLFISSRKYDSVLFIPDPDLDFLPISDPGSRGQKGTGSRIRICNTGSYPQNRKWGMLLYMLSSGKTRNFFLFIMRT